MQGKALKILLISHTCICGPEGRPRAEWLARYHDLEVTVVVPQRWRNYGRWLEAEKSHSSRPVYKVEKIRFPWMGPAQWYLHWYPNLKRVLRAFRPDIIDLWEEPWSLVSAQTCRLRNRLLPAAKIVSETEQNVWKHLPPPFEWFRSYTLGNASYAIGRNEEAIEILRRKGYEGKAEVVPNAVDVELFKPLPKQSCRLKMGLEGFVVGYVGRVVVEKGLDDLIDSLAHLPKAVRFVIVGSGPYRRALEERIVRLHLGERVSFLGNKPLHELPQCMNAFDALVLPSRTTPRWKEQFGRVIIEANACGVPVIGSDSGAIPKVIGSGGLVFREGEAESLAQQILKLYGDRELALELGTSGQKQVYQNYTWDVVARRMRRIYGDMINQGGNAAQIAEKI